MIYQQVNEQLTTCACYLRVGFSKEQEHQLHTNVHSIYTSVNFKKAGANRDFIVFQFLRVENDESQSLNLHSKR